MKSREFGKKFTWHHIENIDEKGFTVLRREFKIHPAIISELRTPTIRPRVEAIDKYVYMVIHFPVYRKAQAAVFPGELDIIVSKKRIITITYGNIPSIQKFVDKFSKDEREWVQKRSPAHLIYLILRHQAEFTMRQLEHVDKSIDKIESYVFNDNAKSSIPAISKSMRNILNFKQILSPHDTIIESLMAEMKHMFQGRLTPYFNEVQGMHLQVSNSVQNHLESIRILQQTNDSLLTNKTNEVMKLLTIVTVAALPIMLISSIYGMNVGGLPFIGQFPSPIPLMLLLLIMLGSVFLLYLYFRKRKWM